MLLFRFPKDLSWLHFGGNLYSILPQQLHSTFCDNALFSLTVKHDTPVLPTLDSAIAARIMEAKKSFEQLRKPRYCRVVGNLHNFSMPRHLARHVLIARIVRPSAHESHTGRGNAQQLTKQVLSRPKVATAKNYLRGLAQEI